MMMMMMMMIWLSNEEETYLVLVNKQYSTVYSVGESGDSSDCGMVRPLHLLKNLWDLQPRDLAGNRQRLFTSSRRSLEETLATFFDAGQILCFYALPM